MTQRKKENVVQLITAETALVFKAVRLQALQDAPTAFGSTYAEACTISDDEWVIRAAQCTTEMSVGYLAMDGSKPCGIARATPDDQDPDTTWVESMWVAPSHRRLGIGSMLICKIVAWAEKRNIRALKLDVTSNNERAISFYQQLGFSMTGSAKPYPNAPTLTEWEMAKLLR